MPPLFGKEVGLRLVPENKIKNKKNKNNKKKTVLQLKHSELAHKNRSDVSNAALTQSQLRISGAEGGF